MKVKSTGLGKTQLTAHFDGFTAKEGGEDSAVLVITSTEPVHWHIECDLGGSDLRRFAAQVLSPGMIWHLVKVLVKGGEARGFVMEKEGGRRSRKERVARQTSPDSATAVSAAAPAAGADAPTTTAPGAEAPSGSPPTTDVTAALPPLRPAPAAGLARAKSSDDSPDREQRERRRAERRRQREEAARQYVTAG